MVKLFFLILSSFLFASTPLSYEVRTISQVFQQAQEEFKDKHFRQAFNTLHSCENYVHCQTMLGFFYANGIAVDINKSKAIDYFKKAIDKNSSESLYNLGSLYLKDKKYGLALKYLKQVPQNTSSYSLASYNLGLLYIYGWGVKKDYCKALDYMQTAKSLGYEKANEPIIWLKKQSSCSNK